MYAAYPIQLESALILLQIKCDGQVSLFREPYYSSRLPVCLIARPSLGPMRVLFVLRKDMLLCVLPFITFIFSNLDSSTCLSLSLVHNLPVFLI